MAVSQEASETLQGRAERMLAMEQGTEEVRVRCGDGCNHGDPATGVSDATGMDASQYQWDSVSVGCSGPRWVDIMSPAEVPWNECGAFSTSLPQSLGTLSSTAQCREPCHLPWKQIWPVCIARWQLPTPGFGLARPATKISPTRLPPNRPSPPHITPHPLSISHLPSPLTSP
jgi:hypothetical protein